MRQSRLSCGPSVASDDATLRSFSQIDRCIAGLEGDLLRHARNVAWLAARLCDALQVAPSIRERIVSSAYCHDIGKTLLPLELLEKPGLLTVAERALVTEHATRGADLLARIAAARRSDLSIEIETALLHHERWDGSGYPQGLSATQIPLPSRIVAIADVYDALVSVRSYKPAWPHASAIALIRESSGSHFDPRCVDAFVELAGTLVGEGLRADRKIGSHAPALTCAAKACESAIAASSAISIGSTCPDSNCKCSLTRPGLAACTTPAARHCTATGRSPLAVGLATSAFSSAAATAGASASRTSIEVLRTVPSTVDSVSITTLGSCAVDPGAESFTSSMLTSTLSAH